MKLGVVLWLWCVLMVVFIVFGVLNSVRVWLIRCGLRLSSRLLLWVGFLC